MTKSYVVCSFARDEGGWVKRATTDDFERAKRMANVLEDKLGELTMVFSAHMFTVKDSEL